MTLRFASELYSGSKAPVLTAGEIRANIANITDCDLDSMMYPQIYISGILSECFNALTVWCPYCLRLKLWVPRIKIKAFPQNSQPFLAKRLPITMPPSSIRWDFSHVSAMLRMYCTSGGSHLSMSPVLSRLQDAHSPERFDLFQAATHSERPLPCNQRVEHAQNPYGWHTRSVIWSRCVGLDVLELDHTLPCCLLSVRIM